VEVDVETGYVRVLEVVCADDVGRAVNPQLVQGQIEGAIVQALGYTIMEDFQQTGGYIQTAQLSTYLIPTVKDIPGRIESIILEYPDPIGPWGARGVGEMPYLPLPAAIVAAVQDALGVWFNDFPLTPEHVVTRLMEADAR
jgi:CO/xanthine dehydrogenase Mo-binding subunit